MTTTRAASGAGRAYLALGDSYTVGEGIASEHAWPARLARTLAREGLAIDAPHVIARTGWTTDELAAAVDAEETRRPLGGQRLATLLVGVNDQYRGRALDAYASAFAALLERTIAFASGEPHHVLVLSIPDWGVTPFGRASGRDPAAIARELDACNASAQAACAARDVAFIDITTASRRHGAEAAMLADDGLHPSAAMHALWAQCALPAARRALAR